MAEKCPIHDTEVQNIHFRITELREALDKVGSRLDGISPLITEIHVLLKGDNGVMARVKCIEDRPDSRRRMVAPLIVSSLAVIASVSLGILGLVMK